MGNEFYGGKSKGMKVKMIKKNPLKSGLAVMAGTLLIGSLMLQGCLEAEADAQKDTAAGIARPVKAVCLKSPEQRRQLLFPGNAKAVREVDLAFRVSGPLVELNYDTGDRIEKGQIIARIDPRDFRVRIKTLEANLEKSKANRVESRLQYDRYKHLVNTEAAAKAKYDEVKAVWEMAVAQVKADRKSLEDAKNELEDTYLRAPFTGYVNLKYVENYENVAIGNPIISVVDMSVMEVEFGIPEDLVSLADQFTTYQCRFDAIPGKIFGARFKEVGKKPGTSNQTYPLTVILEGEDIKLIRDGMAGQVSLTLPDPGEIPEDAGKRFWVPASAVVNIIGQGSFVWVVDETTNTVDKRQVKTFELTSRGIEVQGDLVQGEWVVVAGASYLKPGQAARILRPASKTNIGNEL